MLEAACRAQTPRSCYLETSQKQHKRGPCSSALGRLRNAHRLLTLRASDGTLPCDQRGAGSGPGSARSASTRARDANPRLRFRAGLARKRPGSTLPPLALALALAPCNLPLYAGVLQYSMPTIVLASLLLLLAGCGSTTKCGGNASKCSDDASGSSGGSATNGGSSSTGGRSATGGATTGGRSAATGGADGEAQGLVDCDLRKVLCRVATPVCADGQFPSVIGTCYGPCTPIESCACSAAEDCPDNDRYTCWRSMHCGPFVD